MFFKAKELADGKKMTAKKKENQKDAAIVKKIGSADRRAPVKDSASELDEPKWSVVNFENCVARNLTYDEAAGKLKKLAADKIAGLCIVTDEAAGRIKN